VKTKSLWKNGNYVKTCLALKPKIIKIQNVSRRSKNEDIVARRFEAGNCQAIGAA
jgi:hypothetical protein